MYNNLPIQITPCNALDLQDGSFVKLNLSETQHTKMNAFVANIPTLLAANELAKAYVVEFPKNVTGTLMHLKDGGVGSQVIGENGKIVAQASFHGLGAEALALNAFSVFSDFLEKSPKLVFHLVKSPKWEELKVYLARAMEKAVDANIDRRLSGRSISKEKRDVIRSVYCAAVGGSAELWLQSGNLKNISYNIELMDELFGDCIDRAIERSIEK